MKREQTKRIARIIFERVAAQMGGFHVADEQWSAAYEGWVENPALFPLVEACIDAAHEIERLEPKISSEG